jgi:hypothetical protein
LFLCPNSPEPFGSGLFSVTVKFKKRPYVCKYLYSLIPSISTEFGVSEPEVPFYMKCDKPFVFVLYADAGGVTVPLFTGVVNHVR